ncbi:Inherit from NOG: N-ethylmaleimide-sensitive factor attachment protein, gamma [Seminavis robusta]|uniref:Inherit from NOG: N-ethylmaleimide-sensitive factor attachment protein, gamma n=1 Tax=Seminavis robusta TaxID=568900 RepID=A0A9N8EM01_9STRA|nr:Inherit from NOG: N-ethylmaleimide-sensitive factor attachment protein, gamma [Seminavis robusta]|eukprot:Sro1443_g273150.1 Inherit from NOG: N-ethylmaleimide-sensitive factor attachment protein, gamma (506) ;mRNA; f:9198-10715
MSHKKNAAANRDALFGGAGGGGGGPKHKKNAASNRDALFGNAGGGGGASSNSAPPKKSTQSTAPSSKGYAYGGLKEKRDKNKKKASMLSPEARAAKMKEAQEYKEKANKCMQSGFFKKQDPVMASTFYKRAADAYQVAGEERLERLYRVSSADCQMKVGAFATAAAEYARAAELLMLSEAVEDTLEQKRRDGSQYHKNAAEAWRQMNEPAKAAASMVQSALAFLHQDNSEVLSKDTLSGLEEAVESFVPDPLNPYCRYRQTGVSAFIDPDSDEIATKPSAETLELAKNHIVSRAYSHEPIWDVIDLLVGYGEYASALYAAGASSTLLSRDGISTLTLSRSYCMETVLTLAMGDPIAAEQNFLSIHCQKSHYLNSRECKLSEELFRAVKMRDIETLDEVRSPEGSNRACLANMHPAMRELVSILRVSGVAKRGAPPEEADKPKMDLKKADKELPTLSQLAQKKTGYEGLEVEDEEGENLNAADLDAELDALNFEEEEEDEEDWDLR